MARRIRVEIKRRQIQPVISSLSVLHSPEQTKRFTESGEKRRGRKEIKVTWWRKRRVQRGKRAVKPAISLLSKNGY